MATLKITCPSCLFSKELPSEKVPDRPVQVTCPKCRQSFSFNKAAVPATPVPTPPPPTPPATSSIPHRPPTAPRTAGTTGTAKRAGTSTRKPHVDLLAVGELFSRSWQLFRQRWPVLTGLFLLAAIGAVVPPLLVAGSVSLLTRKGVSFGDTGMLLLTILVAVISFMFLFRGIAAFMAAALDESAGFREAISRGNSCWLPLLWVTTLYGFIVGGASLLLIIPGIIAGTWFFAAPYIAVSGKARGMESLLRSRAIVQGRFWPVLIRMFLIWLISAVVGVIPVIGPILSLVMVPYALLYHVVLYRDLEESLGNITFESSSGEKAKWLLLGLAGYVLVSLAIFLIAGATYLSNLAPLLKSGSIAAKGRQVIIIPPPSGEIPSQAPPGGGTGFSSPPTAPAGITPTIEIGPAPGPASSPDTFPGTEVSVFIYAVNAPGTIRVNGRDFKTIKPDPDMQYNINSFGEHFRAGENSIEFDVTPTPVEGRGLPPSIHMKVSMGGRVLGEWRLSDSNGWPRSVTVALPEGKLP